MEELGIKLANADEKKENFEKETVIEPVNEEKPLEIEENVQKDSIHEEKIKDVKKENRDKCGKAPIFLTSLLGIILVISYMFVLKTCEPAKNILITGGIYVYPLTFLIVAYICKYYDIKRAYKSVFTGSLIFITFIGVMMIGILIQPTSGTSTYNNILQYVFASSSFDIMDFTIFYPNVGQFFGTLVAFLVSHILFIVIYKAIKDYTLDALAMGLSVFIAYIVDRVLFVPILYASGLSSGFNTFNFVIQCLTSEFIAAILCSIIIIILYVIISAIKKKTVKNN